MNMVLVSIIIPIYNSQKTLERTLVSIRLQTWKNIEILMINDGSTDHSVQIAERYMSIDSRFKLIQQNNAGVSQARNNGLIHAAGKYIMFIDSDDWIKKNAVETFVSYAERNNADLVVSWFYRVIDACIIPMGHIRETRNLTGEQFAEYMSKAPANFYYGVVWNKCYRRDMILNNGLQFSPHLNWCEDELFNLEYLQYAKKITAVNIPLYYYVKNAGSICESQFSFRKTFMSKYEILGYYKDLYKSMNLYKDNKFKINSFMFATAKDTGNNEYFKIKVLKQPVNKQKKTVRIERKLKEIKIGQQEESLCKVRILKKRKGHKKNPA